MSAENGFVALLDARRLVKGSRLRVPNVVDARGVPAILLGVATIVAARGVTAALFKGATILPESLREARHLWLAVRARPELTGGRTA